MSKTYEEWRVTGTWPVDGKPFDLDWRSDRCDAEAEARKWADWAETMGGVTEGPHLHKRTVTVTDWEDA